MLDDRRPDLFEELEVLLQAPGVIPADEGGGDPDPQPGRSIDHLEEVLCVHRRLWAVFQVVGIVAQTGYGNALFVTVATDLLDPLVVQAGDVDMGDPGIAPLGLSHRPAEHLHAVVAQLRGQIHRSFETQIFHNSTDKTKFDHKFSPR